MRVPSLNSNKWIPAVLTAAGLLCLNLPLLANQVSWSGYAGDSGDFLAAALTGGVPHPSGYPTYLILLRLFLALPSGNPVWRGSLLSALTCSGAGALLCAWVQRELLADRHRAGLCGFAAGLAWGSAPLVWTHALIVEVHALQSFFVALFLWWYSQVEQGGRQPWLPFLSLLLGFAIGNHLTTLLLIPAALYALRQAKRSGTSLRRLAVLAGLALPGGLIYLLLPLAARLYPPVNWGNPQTFEGLWWLISGRAYQGLLFDAPSLSLARRIPAWARLLTDQFGAPGILLGVFGWVQSPHPRPALKAALLWILTANSLFAILYRADDSMVYLLPAYLAWAAAMGLGIEFLLTQRKGKLAWGPLLVGGSLVFILARLPFTARDINPASDQRASIFVEAILQQAPEHALIITSGDQDTFPLWYAHYGLQQRTDLRVLVGPLGQYPWYRETIAHHYPDLVLPVEGFEINWTEEVIRLNPARALCRTTIDREIDSVEFACLESQ